MKPPLAHPPRFASLRHLARDPRHFQIAVLSGLFAYGATALDFEVTLGRAAVTLAVALGTQSLLSRRAECRFDPRSALISGLSLCLLLRTNSAPLAAAAAFVAIASKFFLRWNGKHVFNPTNFAIVLAIETGLAWVSPGQWGNAALLALAVACLGGLVVYRAARSDVTWAFLLSYSAILFGRATWLGQSASIPLHQLGNGAFLIFAFFMISDPRTTPDSRRGRILYAALVALGACFVSFILYRPNGLLLSLVLGSLLVPAIDYWLPGARHGWPAKEDSNAPSPSLPPFGLGDRLARVAAHPDAS